MTSNRHFVLALVASVIVFALGFGLLVWPALSRAAEVSEEIAELGHKNRTLEERQALVSQLSSELDVARALVARNLKRIPAEPEVAALVTELSMPADGYTIADQTFTAAPQKPASTDEAVTARVLPLTVDLVGRYSAVLEVIRRAETNDRLVRVSSVRLRRHPDKSNVETDDDAVLSASITLEAVFDPGRAKGAKP